jgi:hypothetical protein
LLLITQPTLSQAFFNVNIQETFVFLNGIIAPLLAVLYLIVRILGGCVLNDVRGGMLNAKATRSS